MSLQPSVRFICFRNGRRDERRQDRRPLTRGIRREVATTGRRHRAHDVHWERLPHQRAAAASFLAPCFQPFRLRGPVRQARSAAGGCPHPLPDRQAGLPRIGSRAVGCRHWPAGSTDIAMSDTADTANVIIRPPIAWALAVLAALALQWLVPSTIWRPPGGGGMGQEGWGRGTQIWIGCERRSRRTSPAPARPCPHAARSGCSWRRRSPATPSSARPDRAPAARPPADRPRNMFRHQATIFLCAPSCTASE